MAASTILIIILGVITVDFLLETSLDLLNAFHKPKHLPKVIEGLYSEEELEKSHAYQRAHFKLGLVNATISFLIYVTVIITGALGAYSNYLNQYIDSSFVLTAVFFGSLILASDLLSLPFSLINTFSIEEKFGFNKMTVSTFFLDKLKGYLLMAIIGGGILWVFLTLIDWLNHDFWMYFWAVAAGFILFTNIFYTSLIVPLFNKLTPLPDGELKEAIEAYSKNVNFPLTKIYVINGSKRSTKANAYFSGLGSQKKIVLFDTLIENHSTEELIAILAHEVGHFKRKHIIGGMALSILQIGLILFLLSLFIYNEQLSLALGSTSWAIHLNLIAFSMLLSPLSKFIGMLMNLYSRKNEYEADAFAAETSSSTALQSALKSLSTKNLSNLTPHPAYVFYHYSHPPLVDRLNALAALHDSKKKT